ncbi:sensor domain-containing phosphodiesterase [Gordonia rubripertincta]|uniref:EAL domain-containing protein n=1 Tax=Gordonia rubripertincta TaxID=36822 RepID=A0ABT4N036_GORRU|nr:EAL domain-containing protein [Gordonia rubripertincta]MCZ4551821.1 EAL domain-containing protein [Gordonia rubripertincta]
MTDDDRRARSAAHYTQLATTPGLTAVVELAAQVTGCPIAMVNVVDGAHQYTIAAHGISAGLIVPLRLSGCARVVAGNAPIVISDAADHGGESDLMTLMHKVGFRAYAGVPVLGREGLPVATVCVLDQDPHSEQSIDIAALERCAILAGDALDAARSRGTNFSPTGLSNADVPDTAVKTIEIGVGEVASAVDNDEIVPWYMPIIDLENGNLIAVEALARWLHPTLGVLPPGAFVPLIENTDLIIDFDLAILARALDDLQRWRSTDTEAANVRVAVNFSAHHFYRPDCADRIDKVATDAGIAAESIILEITETVAVPTTALINSRVINDLQERGYIVVLDDIGGPWLPAEHLLSFGVDGLKADRAVGSSLQTPTGRAIARALTALTAELGQFLVIEGIETAEQAQQARLIGASYGQGFYWSAAQPAHAFSAFRLIGRPS